MGGSHIDGPRLPEAAPHPIPTPEASPGISSSASPPPPSSPHSSIVSDAPSFADHLDIAIISALATNVRQHNTGETHLCTTDPAYEVGSRNVVWFIAFDDGAEWVIRVPIPKWSPLLERRMKSDLLAVDLIRKGTTIPIPEIHDYSVTPENSVGRPYLLLSRARGKQLAKSWFDPEWFTDARRSAVFRSLAENLLQLKSLEFPAIGELCQGEEGDSITIAPLLPSLDEEDDTQDLATSPTFSGPYNSTHTYFLGEIDKCLSKTSNEYERGSLALLRLFAGAIPNPKFDGPPFVLGKPDFNSRNIFVDDEGNVIDFIDWDESIALPRELGYASYPSWITRDWDPTLYAYHIPAGVGDRNSGLSATQIREQQQEDSPETLQEFRDEYLAVVSKLDPGSAELTSTSHVMKAISIAVSTSFLRGNVVFKLREYLFGQEDYEFGRLFEEQIQKGEWIGTLPHS